MKAISELSELAGPNLNYRDGAGCSVSQSGPVRATHIMYIDDMHWELSPSWRKNHPKEK